MKEWSGLTLLLPIRPLPLLLLLPPLPLLCAASANAAAAAVFPEFETDASWSRTMVLSFDSE